MQATFLSRIPRRTARAVLATLGTLGSLTLPLAQAQTSFSLTPSAGQLSYSVTPEQRFQWKGSARQLGFAADVTLPNGMYFSLSHAGTNGGTVDFDRGGAVLLRDIDMQRSDTSLTFGDTVFDELNMFLGLRTATARLDNGIDTRFSTTGFFAGVAYPLAVGPATLSFSAALGVNQGKWSDRSGSVSDAAVGLSAGARFVYPLGKQATAGLGLKTQRYRYNFTAYDLGFVTESLRVGEAFVSVSF